MKVNLDDPKTAVAPDHSSKGTKHGGSVKTEKEAEAVTDSGTMDEFIIVLKIPKPEVSIFAGAMRTRYMEMGSQKSFLEKIYDPELLRKSGLSK